MSIRFKTVEDEEGLFYHIKDIKLNYTSQQKFFKKQAIYVCEKYGMKLIKCLKNIKRRINICQVLRLVKKIMRNCKH